MLAGRNISGRLIAQALASKVASAPNPNSMVNGRKMYPMKSNIGVNSANTRPKKPMDINVGPIDSARFIPSLKFLIIPVAIPGAASQDLSPSSKAAENNLPLSALISGITSLS